MPNFYNDLSRGQNIEQKVSNALGSTGEIPKHHGDMSYGDFAVEVKADFKAVQTGNICLELCDYYPREPGIILPTGVCKHSLQEHNVLVVHQFDGEDSFLVYEPVTVLRWLWNAVNTNTVRVPRPWNNNSSGGKTMGALISLSTFREQGFVHEATTASLKQVIDNWNQADQSKPTFEHIQQFLTTAIQQSPAAARPEIRGFKQKG